MNYEKKSQELTEFIKNYTPCGWKETIGMVCPCRYFSWYEIEAIEAWASRHLTAVEVDADKQCDYCNPVPRPWEYYNYCPYCGRNIRTT